MHQSDKSNTVERRIWFQRTGASRKLTTTPPDVVTTQPRPMRLSRLMALVIRYPQLVDDGYVSTRAELSQIAEVSRARLTQLMNLLLLAPDIQEEILFLPLTEASQEPISDRDMRPIVTESDWEKQRVLWQRLKRARLSTEHAIGTLSDR